MITLTANYFSHIIKGIHEKSGSRKLCFILGAGASRSSGIPTGAELADRWYKELKKMLAPDEFQEWKRKENIDENDLGTYYGIIYSTRFCKDKESGYEDLNKAMENAKPSFGYSVLAKILSTTDHNIVITTNFDSLTEASLYYYTGKHPLVCSHESLSGFAKPDRNRPLIAKIHRDLLMSPMSDPNDIDKLNDGWKESLDNILSTHIPIVIGYGGNDGSLMGYLENMGRKPSNLFWCIRSEDKTNERVKKLVNKLGGHLVVSKGFDHLMFDLLFAMDDIKLIDGEIEAEAQRRSNEYKEQVKKIQDDKANSVNKEDNVNAKQLSTKAPKESPYTYVLKAEAEPNLRKREEIYLEGIEKFPNSGYLYSAVAQFFHFAKQNYIAAEKYYLKALEIDPSSVTANGNYASLLRIFHKDYDKAEQYYLKTMELDPNNVINIANYAAFLDTDIKDHDKAEKYYDKALHIEPINVDSISSYATFLSNTKKDFDKAEKYYLQALQLNPTHIRTIRNYSIFLSQIKKEYDKAEEYYLLALDIEPSDSDNVNNYASFLASERKDTNKAEQYYLKALKNWPKDASIIGSYALFLETVSKDYKMAEKYYIKALDIAPNDVENIGNYANFLETIKKDYNKAEQYYLKALDIDPDNVTNIGSYASFVETVKKDYNKAEEYFLKALNIDPNHAHNIGIYASFLTDVRKDYRKAEQYYIRALDIEQNHPNNLANYVQLLLWEGRTQEAEKYIQLAFEKADESSMIVELWFYRYAHYPQFLKDAEKEINKLLNSGANSAGWDFSRNIKRAIKDGHPFPKKLKEYAKQISEEKN